MKKILITYGPTAQWIDPVRIVTNISSGKTGWELSKILSKKFKITVIVSELSKYNPPKNVKIKKFKDFTSLDNLLKKELSSSKYDAVIHLAAVSDYSPYLLITNSGIKIKIPSKQKISINENFCIKFKKNFKILNRLKIYSKNKNIKIIPFKLTSSASKKQVIYSIKKLKTEWVIHNDTSKIKRKSHPFTIYHNNIAIKSVKNAYELAKFFENILEDGGKNVSSCS